MPRKKLIITSDLPYHITARSNNKESFHLPIEDSWRIFSSLLLAINRRFKFQIHAFILMNNHYHLIATADKSFPLPVVMEWFQRSANRIINHEARRVNHLFGGPYKASLIESEYYYFNAIKYLYCNSLSAGLASKVEHYRYSSLLCKKIPLCSPISGIAATIPSTHIGFIKYLNQNYHEEVREVLTKSFKKTVCCLPKDLSDLAKEELLIPQ